MNVHDIEQDIFSISPVHAVFNKTLPRKLSMMTKTVGNISSVFTIIHAEDTVSSGE